MFGLSLLFKTDNMLVIEPAVIFIEKRHCSLMVLLSYGFKERPTFPVRASLTPDNLLPVLH
jgi:hypothetical protein